MIDLIADCVTSTLLAIEIGGVIVMAIIIVAVLVPRRRQG